MDDPRMIFDGVRDGKPYPEHGLSYRGWSRIPPRQIRLDELVTGMCSRWTGLPRRDPRACTTVRLPRRVGAQTRPPAAMRGR
jgi:Arc/MetJ family transcription regulator